MEIDEKKLKDAKALADSMMPLPPADVERLASVMEFKTAAKRAPIQHIASYLIITRESLSLVRAGKL